MPSIAGYVIPARRAASEPIVCPVNPPSCPVHDGHSGLQWIVHSQRPRYFPLTVREPHPGQPFASSALNASSTASGDRGGSLLALDIAAEQWRPQ